MSSSSLIPALHWYRCALTLKPLIEHTAHPLAILEAIVKGITESAQLETGLQTAFFWQQHRALTMRIPCHKPLTFQVDLFGADADTAKQWTDTARHYFDHEQSGYGFTVQMVSEAQAISSDDLKLDDNDTVNEVCLDFMTPLPLKTQRGKTRLWLDNEGFRHTLSLRLKKLFNVSVTLPKAALLVLPYYWDYCQISHRSNSQNGHVQYLNGCVNRLYLKADANAMAEWLPWLKLAESIGLGGKISFGLGRFILLQHSPAYFNADLTNPVVLGKIIHSTLEQSDEAITALATNPAGVNETLLAQQITTQLKTNWQPSPYQAFSLPKPNGGFRIVEKLSFADKIVQRHLLTLLQDVLDNTFEEESIGYRKGLSRQLAIERLNTALADGYDYVLESDIADFFPSVDIQLLQQQLDAVLPLHDSLLRQLLAIVLTTPRELAGQLEIRQRGLAVGSPLSPLFANFYLDGFDTHIKARGVKLIRFADDFIILTRGRAAAESLLSIAGDYLQELGLHLNLDKTAIRPIADGFTFLGIHFSTQQAQDLQAAVPEQIRKPVYITEPFAFVGVADDALEVRHGASVLASIPLRRVSEVLSLTPCSWSSQLISKAIAEHVPIVLTAGNGRHVATITGNSARHYQMAYCQMTKYYALGDAQQLSIAQEFVSAKVHNYISLIQQRYRSGTHILLRELKDIADSLWTAPNLETLRGLEGIAARKSFKQIGSWIESPDFQWHGRKRRPPDRINSLLNFAYHLLFCRINVLVRAAGLNPFLGFLHEPNEHYEALVCDIQELFRASIDRFVVKLINLGVIKAEDFIENQQGFWLQREAKNRFLSEFAKELDRQPSNRNLTTLNQALILQVDSIRDFFLCDKPLQFFSWQGKL